jgi:hypothetical protein
MKNLIISIVIKHIFRFIHNFWTTAKCLYGELSHFAREYNRIFIYIYIYTNTLVADYRCVKRYSRSDKKFKILPTPSLPHNECVAHASTKVNLHQEVNAVENALRGNYIVEALPACSLIHSVYG